MIRNITFRCPNEAQSFVSYVARGAPTFMNCDMQGSINVTGEGTCPMLYNCRISKSRSCGVNISDNAFATISHCEITDNVGAGIKISRGASAAVNDNRIVDNLVAGVMISDDCTFERKGNFFASKHSLAKCDAEGILVAQAAFIDKQHKKLIHQYIDYVNGARGTFGAATGTASNGSNESTLSASYIDEDPLVYDSDSDFCLGDHWDAYM